ncbi:MAG TPA: hypothetical protein PK605_08035 [Ignavibacteria bacterium]|nr:hypothetical protein [Bacteroidota bacterium]HRE11486.1 hypothetical protein [Ignavibacteria bacterium]HRF66360.1 hypothetical protein [Ignavibacteria bacterium]HRJ04338.1 hypothetical protein [Ignavibacteria bacterium]HRJ86874.1 hypothetical protein [Ignavibacteria bacterium]
MKKLNMLLVLLFVFSSTVGINSQVNDKRIKFKKGESSATVEGGVIRGERDTYLVGANKNQYMIVTIMSIEDNAVFQIVDTETGYYLEGAGEIDDAKRWEGSLPSKGDYRIVVGGTRGNAEYTLKVYIE